MRPKDDFDNDDYETIGSLPQDDPRRTERPLTQDEEDDDDAPLDLQPLTADSLRALRRLSRYKAGPDKWPMRRRAAVLVALFAGRRGHLRVVLSTRAADMRAHPGEVALPGGKMESADLDLAYTARREAFEEIGLPVNTHSVRYLTSLRPFLTRSCLIVTPVVVFVLDSSIQSKLNPAEVSAVFSHPLQGFIQNTPQSHVTDVVPPLVAQGKKPYRMQYDMPWYRNAPYRMHRFENARQHIIGFTADILIEVATIAYGSPDFERRAPGQLSRRKLISHALHHEDVFLPAATSERQTPHDRRSRL
ncbi:uncharacterized protein L969DRAFT_91673 [Mixia osmundae IAM 14324]|uniref:Nudix hydrolase domain-containing protein n=1 Tax=Mixia osmundae (strain CBS 9802 / IAM 14324 / JCM 22182 / KY 12970) TaxID=764103 RepID=G7E063_MIXOS|nr:uncharacterized protein L969DRAFT_91673 [Mixia osmundae IAM 14324]KEI42213.1 hypothetical protein L969DRAFT_91673 [Mixia osmundae IAM 14324]GAA96223.1 hypothetical protein E5Q_02887 [Mixia osmundae IAM 14324]